MDENRVLFALLNKCLTDAGLEVVKNDGVGGEQPNTHLSIVSAQIRKREYAPYATETSTCVINKSRDGMDGEVGRNNSARKLEPASHEMKLEWNSRWEQSKGVLGATYKRLIDGRECIVRVRCIAVGRHLAIHCEGSLPLDEETSASCVSEPQTLDVAERVSVVHSTRIMATKYVKRIEVDENGTRITARCADLPGLWLDIRNSIVFRILSFFRQQVQGIDRCSLAGLMPEIQLRIFSMVPARDLCALSQTCRAFRVLATHDDLWRRLLKIHFSAHVPIETDSPHEPGMYKKTFARLYAQDTRSRRELHDAFRPFSFLVDRPMYMTDYFPELLGNQPLSLFEPGEPSWSIGDRVPGMRHRISPNSFLSPMTPHTYSSYYGSLI